jgi:cytochrome c peroxidase
MRALPLFLLALSTCRTTSDAPVPANGPQATLPKTAETPVAAAKRELPPAPPLPAIPKGIITPAAAPADNALTADKAELGWMLFFDKRLSADGTMACAQCHHLDKAMSSGAVVDPKVGGAVNKRNSPTVLNLSMHKNFYWDGRAPTLEAVSLAAWKGQLGADPLKVAAALNLVPGYAARFERAFGKTATPDTVTQALASFFRVFNSGNAPFDRFVAGEATAISKQAQEGWLVFNKAQCGSCHVPPMFSDYDFHNLSIGDDPGRQDATKNEQDKGKFKTPSLRNVALTGPYFHDGKTDTLRAAVVFMAKGPVGKTDTDPNWKSVKLTDKEIDALTAMLESLTGTSTYSEAPALP